MLTRKPQKQVSLQVSLASQTEPWRQAKSINPHFVETISREDVLQQLLDSQALRSNEVCYYHSWDPTLEDSTWRYIPKGNVLDIPQTFDLDSICSHSCRSDGSECSARGARRTQSGMSLCTTVNISHVSSANSPSAGTGTVIWRSFGSKTKTG